MNNLYEITLYIMFMFMFMFMFIFIFIFIEPDHHGGMV